MKISVLLPTRNRLDLLDYAIQTVLSQDYSDWEIIVSDNDSSEDIESLVRAIDDERIRYYRTSEFVPVTENWNNALNRCTGDYVLMLGDDDGLVGGSLGRLAEMISRYDQPEVIYFPTYLYAYPGVIPTSPKGYLHDYGCARFLGRKNEPFYLDRDEALDCVRSSMKFRCKFDYNMQFAMISRSLIESMADYGDFFQSPYPDYYAMNAIFFKSNKLLILPEPMVVVGISPKSFGFYYFNGMEGEGSKFLANMNSGEVLESLGDKIIPGSEMNTCWLCSMETLKKNFGEEGLNDVDYERYRFLQYFHSLENVGWPGFAKLFGQMNWRERVLLYPVFATLGVFASFSDSVFKRLMRLLARKTTPHPFFTNPPLIEGKYQTIVEACEDLRGPGPSKALEKK